MKKTFRILLTALAMTSVVIACEPQEQPTPDPIEKPDPEPEPEPEPEKDKEVTFTATCESLASWAKGDKISIFDGTKILSAENTEADGASAKFTVTVAKDAKDFVACYPEAKTLSATGATFALADKQTLPAKRTDAVMIAKTSNTRLFFRSVTSTISVTFAMDNAASFKFTAANDAVLAGEYTVNYTADDPTVTATAKTSTIEVSGTIAKDEPVSFSVLPCNIAGYSLVVLDKEGKEIAHSSSDAALTLAAGAKVDLGIVKSDADLAKVYKVTHVWVYGGTGPEYGGGRVSDILNPAEGKEYIFAGPEGHGIDALKDDYIEIADDGTLNFYAGEDGKHWWMAISKELDPKKFKELSVADKYACFPQNTGKIAIGEDGKVVFTLEDGSEKNATLVQPGEIQVYKNDNAGYCRSITLTSMAIRYDNTIRKDQWDNGLWAGDYDVFYGPRQIYYEIEQMPAGFVVPAAAKTKDETKYVEPDYPAEASFDFTQLPGSYTLKDYKVLGGSGVDPAFVGVVDKSWCWDDTVWCISDDQLDVVATGMNSTSATGTTNYWSGANEKFWDYLWHGGKEDQKDLSSVYDRLPKGKKTWTLDIATMKLTFEGGVEAQLLVPGTFKYEKSTPVRELTINEGQIGILFHNMDMIDSTPQQWSDIDRFVNAPILFVMVFNKNK